MLRFPATLRRLATLSVLAALPAALACSDDPAGIPEDLGLVTSFSETGTLRQGGITVVRFVAGRSGPTRVALCGAPGTNFDLFVPQVGRAGTGSGNCESLTFDAEVATTYRVQVTATSGSGPFNICFAAVIDGDSCEAAAPDVSPGIPANYYTLAEGFTGRNLLTALHAIIRNQRVLGYNAARDSMYANIEDQDNDNDIEELYVGDVRDSVLDRPSALLADLNAEHTWPQSLGAEDDPAMSDLHILFAADETANNRRSNHPFGEVTGDTLYITPLVTTEAERSILGLNTVGDTVFEPRASKKGDIARAILYFYVRYNTERTDNYSLANFNLEEATLIEWARLDPPDEYERNRHNLIYRAQGNRNPFVDRPDFLQAVGDFPN